MPTRVSFMSERSAELVLVPRLIEVMEAEGHVVTPLHCWASREGSRMSLACDEGEMLLTLALFARRPKVLSPQDPSLVVKFNSVLYEQADILSRSGITVVAGVPCVTSLMKFDVHAKCVWFALSGGYSEDFVYEINAHTGALLTEPCSKAEVVDESGIARLMDHRSRPMTWTQIVQVMKQVNLLGAKRYFGPWGLSGRYRPTYLVVHF